MGDTATRCQRAGPRPERPSTNASSRRAPAGALEGAGGPYLSERHGGRSARTTAPDGDAWDYFPHDHARSRAYRWSEDGLAGICDDRQRLASRSRSGTGADPILKERMFGLTNSEGNHGEDVKEY